MSIKVGDPIPNHEFQVITAEGVVTRSTIDLFAGKKVVLFAVPGAFTPTCSESHLPGYIALADKIKAKGVDAIYCLSVNDSFVMAAWAKTYNSEEIVMLADGDGSFAKSLGLEMDTGGFGGVRSQRFAMIVDDTEVSILNVEAPKAFEVSNAETILAAL